ncbi:MAG: hypothetical protein V6Z81_11245 [Parvularculales bacterium]
MDPAKEHRDRQLKKLHQAGISDDQITLAVQTSETLLGIARGIASENDDIDSNMREVIAGMAGKPRQ